MKPPIEEYRDLTSIADEIKNSPKYRNIDFCKETLLDLIQQESVKHKRKSEIVSAVRKKLHNIVAEYLGNPNYSQAIDMLRSATYSSSDTRKSVLLSILSTHVSTSERIPFLSEIYPRIFSFTGMPNVIFDLACGIHPLSIPWMNLPSTSQYFAYDIHTERVYFLNQFLLLENRLPLAEVRDILVNPPTKFADVSFLFKEAHRLEQRRQGSTKILLQNINSNYVIISLPAKSMHSQHNLSDKFRRLIKVMIPGKYKLQDEIVIGNELFFFLQHT